MTPKGRRSEKMFGILGEMAEVAGKVVGTVVGTVAGLSFSAISNIFII